MTKTRMIKDDRDTNDKGWQIHNDKMWQRP